MFSIRCQCPCWSWYPRSVSLFFSISYPVSSYHLGYY